MVPSRFAFRTSEICLCSSLKWLGLLYARNTPILFIFSSKCILLHIVKAYAMLLLISHWVSEHSELLSVHKESTELWLLLYPGRDKDLQTKQHRVWLFFSFPILSMWNVAKCPLNQEEVVLWCLYIPEEHIRVSPVTPGRAGCHTHRSS